ncbi:hypothetical protein EVAR_37120_1 [Eumeta japonica]|uniref:Histone-lysine N-methyltransferase SETMAR n=1 Tax=Eumeta variegata TaxID=151549 RepID=A0A4C1XQL4_EUMVA|nr:hypothetical protein EVAR_37120_1 [Eumeta japonica]
MRWAWRRDDFAWIHSSVSREAPHLNTIRRWCAKFNRERVTLHDEICESRTSIAITKENVVIVRKLIEENGVSSTRRFENIWELTGPVYTISLEKQKTVNVEWCATIYFPSVLKKVREKRPRCRILLHRDNASPHTANKMSFLTSEKVKPVTHPAFSQDVAPCNFFIFPNFKDVTFTRILTFTGPEEVVRAINQHVQDMPSEKWFSCFQI